MTGSSSHPAVRAPSISGTGAAAVLLAAALWGTVGPAQVLASSAADPGSLGVIRLLIGGLALAAFRPSLTVWRDILRPPVVGWVLLAAAATGIYQVTFMHAVDQLGAALGTAIALGVAPVATGLFALWWARERLTIAWIGGTIGAIVGCVVLLNPWSTASSSVAAVGIAVISGCCYGIYTVAAKRFLQTGAPAIPATALTLLIAGTALSPLLAIHPAHLLDVGTTQLIAWTGLVGTAVAYAAFIYGLRRTAAPIAGTLSLAEPLIAAALGILLLREQLMLSTAIGCSILIAGLVTTSLVNVLGRPSTPTTRDVTGSPRTIVTVKEDTTPS